MPEIPDRPEISEEVYLAAGRACCLARYTYDGPYLDDAARERHIQIDTASEAKELWLRAAVESVYWACREDAARDIVAALDRMRERIDERVSDRKVAACQRVGLHMASAKILEMADKWGLRGEDQDTSEAQR